MRVFRIPPEAADGRDGVAPVACGQRSPAWMATLFEVLARLMAIKARELAAHIALHTVNVNRRPTAAPVPSRTGEGALGGKFHPPRPSRFAIRVHPQSVN